MKDPKNHRKQTQRKSIQDIQHQGTNYFTDIGKVRLSKRQRDILILSTTINGLLSQSTIDYAEGVKNPRKKGPQSLDEEIIKAKFLKWQFCNIKN